MGFHLQYSRNKKIPFFKKDQWKCHRVTNHSCWSLQLWCLIWNQENLSYCLEYPMSKRPLYCMKQSSGKVIGWKLLMRETKGKNIRWNASIRVNMTSGGSLNQTTKQFDTTNLTLLDGLQTNQNCIVVVVFIIIELLCCFIECLS